jgi:hypothetical protein
MAWELFRRDGGDGFEMVGVDGELLMAAPVAGLPLAVEITIEATSTLPEFIGSAEATIEKITEELGGRIAGTGRTSTRLWILVHLPDDEHAARYTQVPLPARAAITVAPANDPEWTIFDRVRPVEMEEQSMRDLAVMAELHAAGDVGGVRTVEHVVTGLDPERSDSFGRAAATVGFIVSSSDDNRVVLVHEADPTDITPDSWTLRLIAERHAATYEGWRCEVVRPVRSTRRKGRWRRR